MTFVKAERQRVWLKMAITGPSGSGKTFGALRLGFGLGKKIALIDTENGSGSLYADLGHYDQQMISAPFTVQKYITAIHEAVAAGYDVLIIDSLSHAWAGDGGLLDQKTAKDSRGGNGFSNWGDISKVYEQFKSAILQSPIHIIGTMRSKQDYVIEQDSRGKQAPKKVGMAPIQREGMEYEFTTVFDVDMSHTAATSKDRTGLFTDEISQITEDHGRRLSAWLSGGAAPRPQPAQETAEEPALQRDRPRSLGTHPEDRPAAPTSTSPPASANPPACTNCGKALTRAQQELSVRNYGEPFCPACQRDRANQRSQPASPVAASGLSPWEEVVQIMSGYTAAEKTICLDRFQAQFGIRNVKSFDPDQIEDALAYLKTGDWPYEAAFQESLKRKQADEEDDPFAEEHPLAGARR